MNLVGSVLALKVLKPNDKLLDFTNVPITGTLNKEAHKAVKFTNEEKSVTYSSSKDPIFLFGSSLLSKEHNHGRPPDNSSVRDDRELVDLDTAMEGLVHELESKSGTEITTSRIQTGESTSSKDGGLSSQ